MKILFLSQQFPFPPHLNGFTVRAFNVLRGIAKMHEVHLVAFVSNPVDPYALKAVSDFCKTVRVIPVEERHRRIGDRLTSLVPAEVKPYVRAAAEADLGSDYDILHAEGAYMATVAGLWPDLPALVSPSDALSLLEWQLVCRSPLAARFSRLVRWSKTVILERSYSRFRSVVVVAEKDARHLRHITASQIRVIPNGVDTEYFQPHRGDSTSTEILFTGVLSYPPNVDAACFFANDVLPLVRRNHPGATFRVVGRSPTRALSALHNPFGGVDIVGEVPDLRPYMDRASVYVSPLRMGAGIKNKVLEALAMALPLVVTPMSLDGIEAEIGRHCLVGQRPDELARAVSTLLDSPATATSLGKSGRDLVMRKYSWDAAVDAYLTLYNSISEGKLL